MFKNTLNSLVVSFINCEKKNLLGKSISHTYKNELCQNVFISARLLIVNCLLSWFILPVYFIPHSITIPILDIYYYNCLPMI